MEAGREGGGRRYEKKKDRVSVCVCVRARALVCVHVHSRALSDDHARHGEHSRVQRATGSLLGARRSLAAAKAAICASSSQERRCPFAWMETVPCATRGTPSSRRTSLRDGCVSPTAWLRCSISSPNTPCSIGICVFTRVRLSWTAFRVTLFATPVRATHAQRERTCDGGGQTGRSPTHSKFGELLVFQHLLVHVHESPVRRLILARMPREVATEAKRCNEVRKVPSDFETLVSEVQGWRPNRAARISRRTKRHIGDAAVACQTWRPVSRRAAVRSQRRSHINRSQGPRRHRVRADAPVSG